MISDSGKILNFLDFQAFTNKSFEDHGFWEAEEEIKKTWTDWRFSKREISKDVFFVVWEESGPQ